MGKKRKPKKTPTDKPAQASKKSQKKLSPLKKAILVPLTLGAIGLAALGIIRIHPAERPTPVAPFRTPAVARTYMENSRNAMNDDRHIVTPDVNKTVLQGKNSTLVLSENAQCIQCHQMDSLPFQIISRLKAKEEQISALFPKKYIHSKLEDGIIFLPAVGFNQNANDIEEAFNAYTGNEGITYKLPAMANSVLKEHNEGHEIAHYLTDMRTDYIGETWAFGAAALSLPLDRMRGIDGYIQGNKYIPILQRAALANHHDIGRLQVSEHPDQMQTVLSRYADTLTPGDIEAFKPIFKNAFTEYRKNNAFWDAAIYKYQNPYIIFDALLAQKMLREKNPNLVGALKKTLEVKQMAKTIEMAGHRARAGLEQIDAHKHPLEAYVKRIQTMDYMMADLRQHVSQNAPTGLRQQDIDGRYYAAIHRLFLDKRGNIKYDAVRSQEINEHLQQKIKVLKIRLVGMQQDRDTLKGHMSDPVTFNNAIRRLDHYTEIHKTQLATMKEMVRTGRFIR